MSPLNYQSSLCDVYNLTFEVLKADTPALLEEVYKLRYQIYCVENAFEDPSEHLDGLEIDAYDSHSVHYLLRHRASGLVVGSVRLVLPMDGNPLHSLPIQSVCPDIPALSDPQHMRRAAETSRFCISKQMRRRLMDGLYTTVEGADAETGRRAISSLTLGLIRGTIEALLEHGITHNYMICEPPLLRVLGKAGVNCTPIGPMIEYHGLRQPVLVASASDVLENAFRYHQDIWTVLSDNGRLKPVHPQE